MTNKMIPVTINYNGHDYLFTFDKKYTYPGQRSVTIISRGMFLKIPVSMYKSLLDGKSGLMKTFEEMIQHSINTGGTTAAELVEKVKKAKDDMSPENVLGIKATDIFKWVSPEERLPTKRDLYICMLHIDGTEKFSFLPYHEGQAEFDLTFFEEFKDEKANIYVIGWLEKINQTNTTAS